MKNFDDAEFVECIGDIFPTGIGEMPDKFPVKGKIYTLEGIEYNDDVPDVEFLVLEELVGFSWNSDFFRPVTRNIIEELLDLKAPNGPEIEKNNFKKVKDLEDA